MDSLSVTSLVKMIQSAFQIIALLQFTAYMWPKHTEVKNGDSFDYIIVGAGTAGSVIANRLTEDPNIRVLVIEAGGDPPMESDLPGALLFLQRSQYDWNFTAENDHISEQCHQNPFLELTQGMMLGGSSSLNYFQYARGYPIDYDSWAAVANESAWEWKNVLPYFIKSERCEVPEILDSPDSKYHGTDGYLGITKENYSDVTEFMNGFKSLGYEIVNDHNPDHPLGFSKFLATISNGHRQSSAAAFLTPVKDRPNLYVTKKTTVNKIIIKDNTATGIEAVTSEGINLFIEAKKEVIVSAGTFNSAKLLMLSGIGPKKLLEDLEIPVIADLPVGENLQDHPAVVTLHLLNKLDSPQYPIDPHLVPAPSFRGFLALNRKQEYPDYSSNNFLIQDRLLYYFCSFSYRFNHEICDTIYKASKGKMAVYNQIINLAPKSRGKVLLRSSNPVDAPVIYTGQFSDSEDLDNLVKYIQDMSPVLETPFYKSLEGELLDPIPSSCKEFKRQSAEYIRCYAQCLSYSMHHFTSTCPMGTVLDGRLKVHGVEGLRVADASVMPTIPHANPVATVIMIGEKAADFIKEGH